MRNVPLILAWTVLAACTNNSVDSTTAARRAYLGLDKSVSKSLQMAFAGYDAATNANIPAQTTMGDSTGTLVIVGKVDSGNCTQLSMSLDVGMATYSDGKFMDGNTSVSVTYATSTDVTMQPVLGIKLNGSSNNAINGTLVGDYTMTGDLKGTVALDLMLTGMFTGTCPNAVTRVAGSTTVTGTATNSSGGVYDVNVTL